MNLKAYIVVHEEAPLGLAMVAACHATLAMYLKFRDMTETQTWLSPLNGGFRKVVCRVTGEEFAGLKQKLDELQGVLMTESAWDGREIAMAFRPREDWPDEFKRLRLYK
jgi:peptidyl-tRNA hydrolase